RDAQGRSACARRGRSSIGSFAVVVLRRLPRYGLQELRGLLVEPGRIFQADRRFLEECAIDRASGAIGSSGTGMAFGGRIQVQLRALLLGACEGQARRNDESVVVVASLGVSLREFVRHFRLVRIGPRHEEDWFGAVLADRVAVLLAEVVEDRLELRMDRALA